MSDEESFVILGSSPMSSLETDSTGDRKQASGASLESDTPGSRFTSLQNSQINDLKCAQEIATQTQGHIDEMQSTKSSLLNQSINKENELQESKEKYEEKLAASKLWSTTPQNQIEENTVPLNFEDCALKSPLEQQQKPQLKSMPNAEQTSTKTAPCSADGSLAASFIMGDINSDILKTSVYSQFPSISLEASAEDVVKLQNMVTEYSQLKSTIKKANATMKLFYQNSLQWKTKMQTMEEDYKQQLNNCKQEIAQLRKQSDEMDKNFQSQLEALEIARQKDREEYIQEISEKNALLENMRAQIIKLEEQQLASFDIVPANREQQQQNDKVTHLEHELKIIELQRQLSELLASNIDLKDIEKQYLDELTCLKVNLTAAEELIKKNHSEIVQLQSLNLEKDQQMQILETSLKSLESAFEEQKERIALLEAQNEVHRTDFEIEKQSREAAIKEKQQMLQDLRSLQKRNQELIEEQQKIADSYQKRISSSAAGSNIDGNLISASAAAQNYFNNPQRPIRILPSPTHPSPPPSLHLCPICNKAFKSLNILLSHVDDCVDKN